MQSMQGIEVGGIAITLSSSNLVSLVDSVIYYNTGQVGGVLGSASSLEFNSTQFIGNSALDEKHDASGAVALSSCSTLRIHDCNFDSVCDDDRRVYSASCFDADP
jgi:hypothetical protein